MNKSNPAALPENITQEIVRCYGENYHHILISADPNWRPDDLHDALFQSLWWNCGGRETDRNWWIVTFPEHADVNNFLAAFRRLLTPTGMYWASVER